jgi:hypothetical protein
MGEDAAVSGRPGRQVRFGVRDHVLPIPLDERLRMTRYAATEWCRLERIDRSDAIA